MIYDEEAAGKKKEREHTAKEQADSILEMNLSNKRKNSSAKTAVEGCFGRGSVGEGCDVGGEDVRYFLKR